MPAVAFRFSIFPLDYEHVLRELFKLLVWNIIQMAAGL